MAEAAIILAAKKIGVALGGEALKIASSLFANEISLLTELPSRMRRIKSELLVMQTFLGEMDTQTDGNRPVLEAWVEEVRKLAYHIEDIVDEYIHLIAQHQGSGLGGYLKKIVKGSKNLIAYRQIAAQLKEFETNLVHILQMKERWIIHFKEKETNQSRMIGGEMGGSSNYGSENQLPNSSHSMDDDELVGIDDNTNIITRWLDDEDPAARSIISVCGMGGLGKTTLVDNVYRRVGKKFECRAWISISQSYEVDNLLKGMIEDLYRNANKTSIDTRGMDQRKLVETARLFLGKKRYLIILDDVWDARAFNDISNVLVDDNNGSRIIITTRSAEVALLANEGSRLQLGVLQGTHPWVLFCKKAFRNDRERICPRELERLGKDLVKECEGLPLAIVSLGSLLSLRERTESEWKKVKSQLSWELKNNPNFDRAKQVLNLSYKYLPRYLKNCFLHCSMFPEDHVLRRKRLTRLWVAEGFVEKRGSRTMEEVAEDCLKELVDRCMLQVEDRNEFGRIKKCRMHDVVRDLAISLAEEGNFSSVLGDLKVVADMSGETRRLSVHKYGNEIQYSSMLCGISCCFPDLLKKKKEIQSSMELPRLRTFTLFDPTKSSIKSLSSLCSSSRYLTVLDLQGAPIQRVPDEIGKLFNLQFLGLRDTKVKNLPESLGRLRNLQTLDLKQTEIEELPSTTRNLMKLRHLLAEKILDRNFMALNDRGGVRAPQGLWNLKDLQTLRTVEANKEFMRCLGNLRELRSVRIWKVRGIQCNRLCESLSSLPYLSFLSLNAKNKKETLQLEGWDRRTKNLIKLTLKGRLENTTMAPFFHNFADSLQILTLRLSGLGEDPLPSLSQLTNLVHLSLQGAYDGQQLCFCEGWFPKLKQLQLAYMRQLSQVEVQDDAMKWLEFLLLDDLPALMDVPRGIENLRSLEELYLSDLSPDFRQSFEESNGRYKVRHIPMAYYVSSSGDQTIYEKIRDPSPLGSPQPQEIHSMESNTCSIQKIDSIESNTCSILPDE